MAGLFRIKAGPLNIKAHQALGLIPAAGVTSMMATYSSSHAYALSSNRYLTPNAQLLPEKWADRKYATRSEPFWWSCLAKKEGATKKRILRSWMSRRTRIAFAESLRKKGYNTDGTRIDPADGGEVLYGTAQLAVRESCLLTKAEDLRKETDSVLEGIFKIIKKNQIAQQKTKAKFEQGTRSNQGNQRGRNDNPRVRNSDNNSRIRLRPKQGQNQFSKSPTQNNGGFTITKIGGWQTTK